MIVALVTHTGFRLGQNLNFILMANFLALALAGALAGAVTALERRLKAVAEIRAEPVHIELKAGEISLHSDLLLHRSPPNNSNRRRCGLTMRYASTEEIFDEIRSLSPSLAGITYEKLGQAGVLWPCPTPDHPGTSVLFEERFPRGAGKFVPAEFAPAKELPDDEYAFVLNTGRLLEHWHTGSMTRRSRALDALAPEPFVEMHPADLAALGLSDGAWVRVSSRRGAITLKVRCGERTQQGSIFIPFHFREAAANVLTIDALDPFGKIPEYKFCAVKIEPID